MSVCCVRCSSLSYRMTHRYDLACEDICKYWTAGIVSDSDDQLTKQGAIVGYAGTLSSTVDLHTGYVLLYGTRD